MKTITLTSWRRPHLTKEVIESIINCNTTEEYAVFAFVEPGCDETVDVLNSFKSKINVEVIVNEQVLGIAENTRQALEKAFDVGTYNIHLEDDTVLQPGALKFFEWCDQNFRDQHNVGTACAYSTNLEKEEHESVILHRWFGCCAWATWKHHWSSMREMWSDKRKGFARFVGGWQLKNEKLQIYPIHSMCNNIGYNDALAVNGRNINAPKQQLNDRIINEFNVIHRQTFPTINWSNLQLAPSEYILAIDWVHFCMNEMQTINFSLAGNLQQTPWQIINGNISSNSKVCLWDNDDKAFDAQFASRVICCKPTAEKINFLKANNFTLKWRDCDKVGVEFWQK